ncbi:REST corepressor 2 isoform X2 [Anopheles coustani]|uniref:REST corepressor 2 isoform X2 n=1 Tax=Anopheles coustani TaxID=139045 RepID=UPI00265ACC88|nr:REST corepressor 2 isoform X2 [Anopheles coustani]
MVLAERTTESGVRNGRRSRGPSPNGHPGTGAATAVAAGGSGTTDSSSDEENSRKNGNTSKTTKTKSEYEEKIRVGRDYQAVCPELIPQPYRKLELLNDRALLVWSPTKEIPDNKLEEYITVAKDKYGYNGEQALGMLFWHKHDLERAVLDLANFTPFPDEWTAEDRVLFEQAFQFHGKSFHRIRQMLPDKSIASLVKFYYSWKKTRSRTSVMDRQEKMKKNDSSENGSDHGSNEESDNEDKVGVFYPATNSTTGANSNSAGNNNSGAANGQSCNSNDLVRDAAATNATANESNGSSGLGPNATSTDGSLNCTGCGVMCSEVHATTQGKLCGSCHHHWRRTGVLRPTSGPFMSRRARGSNMLGKSGDSHKRRPPKGMYINHDDIVKLASTAQNDDGSRKGNPNDDLLACMDREIVSLLSQIQYNKQTVSGLKRKIDDALEVLKPPEGNTARLNSRWNNEELLLAVQGVRIYGRDFQAIADTLGSKTETQVRAFFMNYRRRFNLDAVLKEFEMASSNSSAKDQSIGSKNNGATVKKDASENPSAEGGGGASVEVADQSLASGSSETDKPKASTPSGEVVEIMDVK